MLEKSDDNSKRTSIRLPVRCECKKHKCQRFSKFVDYRCDDCYHEKIECYEDQIG